MRHFGILMLLAVGVAMAQPRPGMASGALTPDPNMVNPIPARQSLWLEELTWMEARDAIRAGKTTAIIATGGVEQNGPYLAAGKHNYVLQSTAAAIARKLGNALIAPIVAFVPEGQITPPTGHMKYPSTISVRAATFQALLTDIAESLQEHGFRRIILIGDSGGNQAGMKAVAEALTAKWAGGPAKIRFIPEYYGFYDSGALSKWLVTQGIHEVDEGLHDNYAITAMVMATDPNAARVKERRAKGKLSINGVALDPVDKTVALGKKIVEYRADVTVAAIQKAFEEAR